MSFRQRLARLEARSELRYPQEQMQICVNFINPDGTQDADFVNLDDEGLYFHRRPDETVAMFKERVFDELRFRRK
jgi:hypothetical protein